MPAKNSIKTYIKNGFYHIYNRGVEKRNIFLDEQDYRVFLSYLKIYLSPKEDSVNNVNSNENLDYEDKNIQISKLYTLNNFFNKIGLISYVLMPNHFHLELQQTNKKDIEIFMRSLITKYTMYFNRKYKRVGPLFQGRYKAVLILGSEYLLHLSCYIHVNPLEQLTKGQQLQSYPWSSYPAYVNNLKIKWLKKDFILSSFINNQNNLPGSYKKFVEEYIKKLEENNKAHKDLLLD
ncbi:MAG: transposase [Patescibacteria group bacterium]